MPRPAPPAPGLILGLSLALVAGSGCSNSGLDTPTSPTATVPVAITETFEGTLTVNGAATHPFAAQRSGTVTAQVTVLDPDMTATIGLSLGTWNGSACQIVLANDAAVLNTSLIGVAQSAANFCVRVYDVGKLTDAVLYQIVVSHSS